MEPDMANLEHVKTVKQGAKAIAAWRAKNPETRLDLRYADLREANLGQVDLNHAGLLGADLRDANLGEANLSEAYLMEADLRNAYLGKTNLSKAFLRDADLRWARMSGAILSGADLLRADLSGATSRSEHNRRGHALQVAREDPRRVPAGLRPPGGFHHLPAVAHRDDAADSIPIVLHQL